MEKMIRVENLQKNFRKTVKQPGLSGAMKALFKPKYEVFEAVKDLTFEVPKGEILGFIGANGAGKSTTIKMLTGILTPSSGLCQINGKIPTENRTDYVKDIGVVFGQRTQLWWDLPLRETYTVLKEIYQVEEKIFKRRLSFLNEVLDLSDFMGQPVRTLSLGQRMRADIAASLLHHPKVLFLDEPTIGLDVAVKDNIRRAITQINQEEQTTIILTTHDLADIELLSNRILMIDEGRQVFDGSLARLKRDYGQIHELKIELTGLSVVDLTGFSGFLEAEQNGQELLIKFDSSKITVNVILTKILAQSAIKDMTAKGADIEKIVKTFFRHDEKTTDGSVSEFPADKAVKSVTDKAFGGGSTIAKSNSENEEASR